MITQKLMELTPSILSFVELLASRTLSGLYCCNLENLKQSFGTRISRRSSSRRGLCENVYLGQTFYYKYA